MNNPQLGIDVWEGQLEVDEAILVQNNVKFMFVRLNDINGGHHKDENFDEQWSEAESLHRAPYFVYNPWVTGQQNFNWLLSNMPSNAKAVGIDIEVRKEGYSPAMYASEVDKFMRMAILHWNVVCYTGEWFLQYLSDWPNYVPYWWAQYPLRFYPRNAKHFTWDQLRVDLQSFSGPSNASKCPGQIMIWQLSGDRLILPGNAKPMDVNVFFGDMDAFFGRVALPPPQTDTVTTPYDGLKWIEGKRNGWKFFLQIYDPKKFTFSVHTGELESVPSVAGRANAPIAVNAGDWDRSTGKIKFSAGDPAVVFYGDRIDLFHQNLPADPKVYCVRYLMDDGIIKPYLYDPSDPKYNVNTATEGHSRTIGGVTADGKLMIFVGEGVYPNQGWKLYDAAVLMKEYGCVVAGDWGGGGDTTLVKDGQVLNLTENISENGSHFARWIPQQLLIYPKESNMLNGLAKEKFGNQSVIRRTPSRYGVEVTRKPGGWETEFVRKVPTQPQGTADKSGEMWLELPDGNFVNWKLQNSSGVLTEMFTILREPGEEPPTEPPAFEWPDTYEEERIMRKDNVEIVRYKGTMVKQ